MAVQNREMELTTRVEMPRMERLIAVGDRLVFLGSCFAEYIGRRFESYGLATLSNPLGVLYNPESVRAVVLSACSPGGERGERDLPLFQSSGGEWRCWLGDTSFASPTSKECVERINAMLGQLYTFLSESRFLFVTLGTNVCYRLRETGLTVTNCHKMPGAMFEEYRLSTSECATALADVVDMAQRLNPALHVVFTVSPYRYRKYGFHGSQLSKATLLLAVDEVCRRFPASCTYLPVYEMFMDELRDYRFYAPDMLHPSEVAVDIVWRRIVEHCMSERLQHYLRDYEPIRRALNHRPTDPESEAYHEFLRTTMREREKLMEKYECNN